MLSHSSYPKVHYKILVDTKFHYKRPTLLRIKSCPCSQVAPFDVIPTKFQHLHDSTPNAIKTTNYSNKRKITRRKASGCSPIAGLGVPAHGGDLEGGGEAHPPIPAALLVGAAEETSDGARLASLAEAVDQPHRLPVEVILALHREQRVDPPRRLLPHLLLRRHRRRHCSQRHHHRQHHRHRHPYDRHRSRCGIVAEI